MAYFYQQLENTMDELTTLVSQLSMGQAAQRNQTCYGMYETQHPTEMWPQWQENSSTPYQWVDGIYAPSYQQQCNPYSAIYSSDLRYGSEFGQMQQYEQYNQQPYLNQQQQSYAPPVQVDSGPSLEELVKQMAIQNMQIQQNLKTQVGLIASSKINLQQKSSGTITSQPVMEPMTNINAITLRSGEEFDDESTPVLPKTTTAPPPKKEDEELEEARTKVDIHADISSMEVVDEIMHSSINDSLNNLSPSSTVACCIDIVTPHVSSIDCITSPKAIDSNASLNKLEIDTFENKSPLSNLIKEVVANNSDVDSMLAALKDIPIKHEIEDNFSADVADLYINFAISNICAVAGSMKSECIVLSTTITFTSDFVDNQALELQKSGQIFQISQYMMQPLVFEEDKQFYAKLIEQELPPPEPPPSSSAKNPLDPH